MSLSSRTVHKYRGGGGSDSVSEATDAVARGRAPNDGSGDDDNDDDDDGDEGGRGSRQNTSEKG